MTERLSRDEESNALKKRDVDLELEKNWPADTHKMLYLLDSGRMNKAKLFSTRAKTWTRRHLIVVACVRSSLLFLRRPAERRRPPESKYEGNGKACVLVKKSDEFSAIENDTHTAALQSALILAFDDDSTVCG